MKLKKSVKGMTLVEIIIALAVFTVMALMMVQIGSVTKALMMNTNHMNNKTLAEAPVGSIQDVEGLNDAANNLVDDAGDPLAQADIDAVVNKRPVTFTVTSGAFSATINADKYSSAAVAKEATQNGRNCDTSKHMNGDLEFYVIETETQPTT